MTSTLEQLYNDKEMSGSPLGKSLLTCKGSIQIDHFQCREHLRGLYQVLEFLSGGKIERNEFVDDAKI
jgi:hypothetical protein